MKRWLATVALGIIAAPSLPAQALSLRFTPVDGMRVRRLFQVHALVTQMSDAGTRQGEMAYLGGMSQIATLGEGGTVLHLTFDSLTVLSRPNGGSWQEAPTTDAAAQWAQARFDERLRLAHVTPAEGWQADLLTTLVTGVPGLELPAGPVSARSRWRTEAQIDLGGPLARDGDATSDAALRVPMTVTVDSIVVRTRDTLAYLSLSAAVTRTQRTIERAAVSYEATVGGSLVWSSAWRTFVSAAVRTWMSAVPRDTQGRGRTPVGLVVERTIRASVRP